MSTTQELRNLEELQDLQRRLATAEHMRGNVFGMPKVAKALDKTIVELKRKIGKKKAKR